MKENLKNTKLFLFDLDGTVYNGKNLIGKAQDTLAFIRSKGISVGFLTNNSSVTDKAYTIKLKKLGVFKDGDIIVSSLDCAVDFLTTQRAGKKIYALASNSVDRYLISQGINLVLGEDSSDADVVLVAFDKEINYKKIAVANELLVKGKEYIATHPDIVCPSDGVPIPDVGSFLQLFKVSSGREPDVILGKPNDYIIKFLLKKTNLPPSEITMVGDRLYTDIAFGINAGFNTVLVLSGDTDIKTAKSSQTKADVVLSDINEIPILLK